MSQYYEEGIATKIISSLSKERNHYASILSTQSINEINEFLDYLAYRQIDIDNNPYEQQLKKLKAITMRMIGPYDDIIKTIVQVAVFDNINYLIYE